MNKQQLKEKVLEIIDRLYSPFYDNENREIKGKKHLDNALKAACKKYENHTNLLIPVLESLRTYEHESGHRFYIGDAAEAITYLNKHEKIRNSFFDSVESMIKEAKKMKLPEFMDILDSNINVGDYKIKKNYVIEHHKGCLNRGRKLLAKHWSHINNDAKKICKYFFEIEERGDFRNWLEKQEETEKVKKRFEELGLDYEKWDNPKIAYGYKNGKLERVKNSNDDYVDKVKELATKVMKGSKTGVLKCSPKELWKEISADYTKIKEYKHEDESCEKNCLYVLGKIEENLKENVSKDKNGTNRVEKAIKELKKRIKDNASITSDYDFVFKFWERKPSVDFYEGNDSGVCTSIESNYELSLPIYLIDKAISLVDILVKGKRMGQMYLVACEEDEKPVLFMDSIEYANNERLGKMASRILDSVEPLLKSLNKEIGFNYSCIGNSEHHRMTPELRKRLEERYEEKISKIIKIEGVNPISIINEKIMEVYERIACCHHLDSLEEDESSSYIKVK